MNLVDNLSRLIDKSRLAGVLEFHNEFKDRIETATGSSGNHQYWEGGYQDHIIQCLIFAERMQQALYVRFNEEANPYIVLYFHDIEKIFKYTEPKQTIDKKEWYNVILPKKYGIEFSEVELNALKYIHGEGNDYRKDKRIMLELAAFCHCADVLSSRFFHDLDWEVYEKRFLCHEHI